MAVGAGAGIGSALYCGLVESPFDTSLSEGFDSAYMHSTLRVLHLVQTGRLRSHLTFDFEQLAQDFFLGVDIFRSMLGRSDECSVRNDGLEIQTRVENMLEGDQLALQAENVSESSFGTRQTSPILRHPSYIVVRNSEIETIISTTSSLLSGVVVPSTSLGPVRDIGDLQLTFTRALRRIRGKMAHSNCPQCHLLYIPAPATRKHLRKFVDLTDDQGDETA